MDTLLTNNDTDTFFAVSISGQILPMKYSDRYLAEKAKLDLPPEQAALAEIVTVAGDGNQLLLG